jgi:7-cyano-7-deazaguanine synthase
VHAVSFNYGQRHKIELDSARNICDDLQVLGFAEFKSHTIVDMTAINPLMAGSGSVLVESDTEVPEGHYAEETMAQTVVPNRNMIMLSIAAAKAVSVGASMLVTGVHAGDHAVYPDCRPEFIQYMQRTLRIANEGFIRSDFMVTAPWLYISKAEIVGVGEELHVPWKLTWTCYKGGVFDGHEPGMPTIHCGRCSTCVERLEAFNEAGVVDPVEYADRDFWRKAVDQFAQSRGPDVF